MRDRPTPCELDQAVRHRLARLADGPVDKTGLETRLRALLADATRPDSGRRRFLRSWRSSLALAAAVVLVITVGLILATVGNAPATAAPSQLARLHAHATEATSPALAVESIEEANRVLSGQWRDMPSLPGIDAATLHACCIHDFMDERVVCLVLLDGQQPLTLVVGHARSFRPTRGRQVQVGGRKFDLHQVDDLRMVMTQQDRRFICLMGKVSETRLLEVAAELRF